MIFYTYKNISPLRGFETIVDKTNESFSIKIKRVYTDQSGDLYEYVFINYELLLTSLRDRSDLDTYSLYGGYVKETALMDLNDISLIFEQAEKFKWTAKTLSSKIDEIFKYTTNYKNSSNIRLVNLSTILNYYNCNFDELSGILPGTRLFTFFIPFKDSTFNQVPICFSAYNNATFTSKNSDVEYLDSDNLLSGSGLTWLTVNSYIPSIKFLINDENISTIDVNSNSSVTITAALTNDVTNSIITNQNCDIEISSTGGYINKNKLTIDPQTGMADFKFKAIDLTSEDVITLYAGFACKKNVSNLSVSINDVSSDDPSDQPDSGDGHYETPFAITTNSLTLNISKDEYIPIQVGVENENTSSTSYDHHVLKFVSQTNGILFKYDDMETIYNDTVDVILKNGNPAQTIADLNDRLSHLLISNGSLEEETNVDIVVDFYKTSTSTDKIHSATKEILTIIPLSEDNNESTD